MEIFAVIVILAMGGLFFLLLRHINNEGKRKQVRQIINGIVYDTEDAALITCHNREDLYKSNLGNWFIVYDRNRDSHSDSRLAIEPQSAEEVCKWLMDSNDVAVLQQFFPDRTQRG